MEEKIKGMNIAVGTPIEVTTTFKELVWYIGINYAKEIPTLMIKQEAFKDNTVRKYIEYPITAIEDIKVLKYKK